MQILIIGGAGRVASMIVPHLKQRHTLRVFDLKPPQDTTLDHVIGNLTDFDALSNAAQGAEALLYMAMGAIDWDTLNGVHTAFDVNVKGVYLALKAAREAGAMHAVYCSSMSVYDGDLMTRYFFDEDMPPDARGLYGFTKRLGEEVCRNACYQFGMSANALRLCFPMPDEAWRAQTKPDEPTIATAASDVAHAMLAALDYRNGFQAFMISGDYDNKIMNTAKARRVLGWTPLARPA
jgi:nucleoside-diphosphate-sugar epimerase